MIQRIVSSLLAVSFLLAVFVFTAVLVALAVTTGVVWWAWTWWRERRRLQRGGQVIEGEYRIIEIR
jgi:hypothetical protein